MRNVSIADLESQLSAYLQYVRDGEEVVVRDRNIAVARIIPIPDSITDEERELIDAGTIKLPERPLDLEVFWARRSGNVPREIAIRQVLETREGNW